MWYILNLKKGTDLLSSFRLRPKACSFARRGRGVGGGEGRKREWNRKGALLLSLFFKILSVFFTVIVIEFSLLMNHANISSASFCCCCCLVVLCLDWFVDLTSTILHMRTALKCVLWPSFIVLEWPSLADRTLKFSYCLNLLPTLGYHGRRNYNLLRIQCCGRFHNCKV